MSVIDSLIKRRQFLLGTAGATCALTCKKLAAFAVADGAKASGSAALAAAAPGAVTPVALKAGNRCPHLLSPLRIRNVVLKNRIYHTVSPNYLMQGPENYPTEAWRSHYSNMAKNAAIVSVSTSFGSYPKKWPSKTNASAWDWAQICSDKWEDIPPVYNYVERMIEDVHCEGALALFAGNTGGGGGMPGGGGGAPRRRSSSRWRRSRTWRWRARPVVGRQEAVKLAVRAEACQAALPALERVLFPLPADPCQA